MKKLKKAILVFIVLFTVMNIWLYNTEYRKYVKNAPAELKEARKELTKAYMVHIYYAFLVKIVGIDFQSKLISPVKNFRDYYYHKGLDKLPIDEAERASWFYLFEINLYNFSVKGRYGGLTSKYGADFAKKFINDIYKNIEIFSLYDFRDKKSDISSSALQDYLGLIDIYLIDFNINIGKYLYSKSVFDFVSKDEKFHNKLLNIYKWKKSFLEEYERNHNYQYKKTLNRLKGWYSPYVIDKENEILLSSFILFYKIRNNIFECEQDKKFLYSIRYSRNALFMLMGDIKINIKHMKKLKRKLEYLFIKNEKVYLQMESKNFFDFNISCEMSLKQFY